MTRVDCTRNHRDPKQWCSWEAIPSFRWHLCHTTTFRCQKHGEFVVDDLPGFGTMVSVHKIRMIFHVILQAFTLAIDLKGQGSAAHLKFVGVQGIIDVWVLSQHFTHAKCIAAHIVLDLVHIWKLTVLMMDLLWSHCSPEFIKTISDRLKSLYFWTHWSSGFRKGLGTVHEAANNHRLLSIVTESKESLKTVLVTMNLRNLLWFKAWGAPCPLKAKIVLEEDHAILLREKGSRQGKERCCESAYSEFRHQVLQKKEWPGWFRFTWAAKKLRQVWSQMWSQDMIQAPRHFHTSSVPRPRPLCN